MTDQANAQVLDAEVEQALYAKREKIYPRQVSGLFARLRALAVIALLGGYYFVPWLQWGGRQAVLFDLPARKFYILGVVIWPQDLIYLTAMLIISALSLFFFTALAGRLWCGYACPQTVWTEAFMWIERKIEGDRAKRMKLDKQPWSWKKLSIKSSKHAAWLAFALWTGFTFVGYFTPIRDLADRLFPYAWGGWETFWVLFYSFATYGNAGWLREQVCIYMCPYARFQSAMIDKDTLIVSYDVERGEPRGARRRTADLKQAKLGHCIDCSICVQVCPTGIDIRDGLQYQCIGCAACIDACDEVMDKMGYPRGLVRYTTEHALEGNPTKILRLRVLIYAGILFALTVAVGWSLFVRDTTALDVIRDRNSLFRETMDGLIENVYTLKLINKDAHAHTYRVSVHGLPNLVMKTDHETSEVAAGEVVEYPVRVQVEPNALNERSVDLRFVLSADDDPSIQIVEEARFVGPRPGEW
ncbi:MAG: cytochrome c oxidase accessory protein CcoG [Chromatiales bacterium]|nr:cytochrome c oxidase accessory protein CcoG [Chromatiales bacterium]